MWVYPHADVRSHALGIDEFRGLAVPAFRAVFREIDPFGAPFQESAAARLILYPVGYRLEDEEIAAVVSAAAHVGDRGFYLLQVELTPLWRELVENPPDLGPAVISDWWVENLPPRLLKPLQEAVARGDDLDGEYGDDPAWYVSLDEIEQLRRDDAYPVTFVETALVSESGRWGMLISHEDHAVVGGSRGFIDRLTAEFPSLRSSGLEADPDDTGTEPDQRLLPAPEQVTGFLEDVRGWHDLMSWLPANLEHLYGPDRASDLLKQAGLAPP